MANGNKMVDGQLVKMTDAEQAEYDAEQKAWADGQAERDSTKYQRDRAVAYPSMADQLDDIYHNGVDAWKATIKAVKDKYPKG